MPGRAPTALIARSEDLLNEVAAEVVDLGRNAVVVADVTDEAAITAAVLGAIDGLGGVDVVVNNAGGNSFSSPIVGMRFSGWQKTQRLGVDSTVHVLQTVGPVPMGTEERVSHQHWPAWRPGWCPDDEPLRRG